MRLHRPQIESEQLGNLNLAITIEKAQGNDRTLPSGKVGQGIQQTASKKPDVGTYPAIRGSDLADQHLWTPTPMAPRPLGSVHQRRAHIGVRLIRRGPFRPSHIDLLQRRLQQVLTSAKVTRQQRREPKQPRPA